MCIKVLFFFVWIGLCVGSCRFKKIYTSARAKHSWEISGHHLPEPIWEEVETTNAVNLFAAVVNTKSEHDFVEYLKSLNEWWQVSDRIFCVNPHAEFKNGFNIFPMDRLIEDPESREPFYANSVVKLKYNVFDMEVTKTKLSFLTLGKNSNSVQFGLEWVEEPNIFRIRSISNSSEVVIVVNPPPRYQYYDRGDKVLKLSHENSHDKNASLFKVEIHGGKFLELHDINNFKIFVCVACVEQGALHHETFYTVLAVQRDVRNGAFFEAQFENFRVIEHTVNISFYNLRTKNETVNYVDDWTEESGITETVHKRQEDLEQQRVTTFAYSTLWNIYLQSPVKWSWSSTILNDVVAAYGVNQDYCVSNDNFTECRDLKHYVLHSTHIVPPLTSKYAYIEKNSFEIVTESFLQTTVLSIVGVKVKKCGDTFCVTNITLSTQQSLQMLNLSNIPENFINSDDIIMLTRDGSVHLSGPSYYSYTFLSHEKSDLDSTSKSCET